MFDHARKVADAILFEGYILYPYRASAQKNQLRWQFGALMPRAYAEASSAEHWFNQLECLLEPKPDATVAIKLRCLQVQARLVEERIDDAAQEFRSVASLAVGDTTVLSWDEGIEREVDLILPLDELLSGERRIDFTLPGGEEIELLSTPSGAVIGRIRRQRWPVSGVVRVAATELPGPFGVIKLLARTENTTSWSDPAGSRDTALRHSLVAAHLLVGLSSGEFISLLEPPEWARPAVASCENLHLWPVLVGENQGRGVMLASPIILYDYPEVAPESPGDLFDATEIDEILTLRTLALTEEEKREARETDPRAAAIIDRIDGMPPEILDRLHGAIRYLRTVSQPAVGQASQPWWNPGADTTVSPETDQVVIGGVVIARGSRVRLRPGHRRADAQDIFLAGRTAVVEAVFRNIEDESYLAVSVEDDPAAELYQWHGRFLYFAPDEVEPLEGAQ